jgi:GNAT superfamily N-acetyltransferase
MEPKMMILPLSNVHRDAAAALILPIQQGEFNVPITLADQPDLLDLEAAYFRPGGHFWGAFADGELAGTIGLLAPGDIGVIRKMFVKQAWRGKEWRIAQQLLETLIDYARARGIKDIYLGTIERMKAAHRFYERNGFSRIEKENLPAAFPFMPVDNVFYHLPIIKPARP